MKTHEISSTFGVSEKDVNIIKDVIHVYSGTRYDSAKQMIRKIFCSDITPEHFTVLGVLIGQISATDQMRINNSNLHNLWQRPN